MNEEGKARLTLSAAAQKVLHGAASPRKRGEFVSSLLVQYGVVESGIDQLDVEGMKLQIMGLASALKTLEGRLLKVERQLSAMMAGR